MCFNTSAVLIITWTITFSDHYLQIPGGPELPRGGSQLPRGGVYHQACVGIALGGPDCNGKGCFSIEKAQKMVFFDKKGSKTIKS